MSAVAAKSRSRSQLPESVTATPASPDKSAKGFATDEDKGSKYIVGLPRVEQSKEELQAALAKDFAPSERQFTEYQRQAMELDIEKALRQMTEVERQLTKDRDKPSEQLDITLQNIQQLSASLLERAKDMLFEQAEEILHPVDNGGPNRLANAADVFQSILPLAAPAAIAEPAQPQLEPPVTSEAVVGAQSKKGCGCHR
jgi:chromosome segregation ATPase